jgi:hypothetical protein
MTNGASLCLAAKGLQMNGMYTALSGYTSLRLQPFGLFHFVEHFPDYGIINPTVKIIIH